MQLYNITKTIYIRALCVQSLYGIVALRVRSMCGLDAFVASAFFGAWSLWLNCGKSNIEVSCTNAGFMLTHRSCKCVAHVAFCELGMLRVRFRVGLCVVCFTFVECFALCTTDSGPSSTALAENL